MEENLDTQSSMLDLSRIDKVLESAQSAAYCTGDQIEPECQITVISTNDGTKVDFPCTESTQIENLLLKCHAASFGKDGEQVLDETYRSAYALNPSDFATQFNVADGEILVQISRWFDLPMGFKAVLYKLNVYGEGGHFKEHVDTPVSSSMFGSLVVCLPCKFEGGDLVVNGPVKDQETVFNWSKNSASHIQWAAFYSDCIHEILPVTEGYRVTLTYNLLHSTSLLAQPSLNPLKTEVSSFIEQFKLTDPPYKKLVVSCIHQYPFGKKHPLFLHRLKGPDFLIAEAFKEAGCSVSVQFLTCINYEDGDKLYAVPNGRDFDGTYQFCSWNEFLTEENKCEDIGPFIILGPVRDYEKIDKVARYGNEVGIRWVYGRASIVASLESESDEE